MKTTVLLVDDHVLLRAGIRRILQSCDEFEIVAEAGDGREAVERTLELDPDVVMMDIWLPHLSGIEATRRIREVAPRSRVVIVSQHERSDFVEAALKAGAEGYVLKTSPADELLHALRSVRDGKCHLSPPIAQRLVDAFARPNVRPSLPYALLTSREREILQLIAEGLSSKEVASELGISTRTVEAHRNSLMQKLDIHKVAGLVRFAVREGLVAP